MIIKLEIECPKCKSKKLTPINEKDFKFYNCNICDYQFIIDITYHLIIKNAEISFKFIVGKKKNDRKK